MSIQFLGYKEWHSLASMAAKKSPAEVDLRDVRVAYPPGSVALLLLAKYRQLHGWPTNILCPRNSDVLNYLERIDLFAKGKEAASFDSNLDDLARHRRYPSRQFTELLTPSDEGFQEALDVLSEFLWKSIATQEARKTFGALEELLTNIADHSAPGYDPAYSCAQVQVFNNAIELALGDLGIGILGSLSRNPSLPQMRTESQALAGALLHGYTRLSNTRTRGGGLRHAANAIIECGGEIRIRSYGGIAYNCPGSSQLVFADSRPAFPGTVVSMRLPRS